MARILIADDEESLCHFLSRALTSRGHVVTMVHTGTDALEKLAEQDFDLLLSDVVMPELDGVGLSLRVSRDYPKLPIILMTGFMSAKARAEDLTEIVTHIVMKPFFMDDMIGHVDSALRRAAA